jgi:ketosteroid isomerase-like protein
VSGDAEALVRRLYAAWPAKDRATVESILADDFHFTSPLDNRLDRETFFARCWPNSATMKRVDMQRVLVDGDLVMVTYELTVDDGKRFRNTEALLVKGGKVHDVEVYFGWDLPHPAKPGGFVDAQK